MAKRQAALGISSAAFLGIKWNMLVKYTVDIAWLWSQWNAALAESASVMSVLWHLLFAAVMLGAVWRLWQIRDKQAFPEWNLLLFGVVAAAASFFGYYVFLKILSYLPRAWYYLALAILLAACIELLGDNLIRTAALRWARLAIVVLLLLTLPFAVWKEVTNRQSNVDLVARKLEQSAQPGDLIVMNPWFCGISFNWYYKGNVRWVTLPIVQDLRTHRYDLIKAKMMFSNPIDDLKEIIGATLKSGHSVWIGGDIRFLQPGEEQIVLPPAPHSSYGWNEEAYTASWSMQLGAFLQLHASQASAVEVPSIETVKDFENIALTVASGWRN
jgi:hypothetical protein